MHPSIRFRRLTEENHEIFSSGLVHIYIYICAYFFSHAKYICVRIYVFVEICAYINLISRWYCPRFSILEAALVVVRDRKGVQCGAAQVLPSHSGVVFG